MAQHAHADCFTSPRCMTPRAFGTWVQVSALLISQYNVTVSRCHKKRQPPCTTLPALPHEPLDRHSEPNLSAGLLFFCLVPLSVHSLVSLFFSSRQLCFLSWFVTRRVLPSPAVSVSLTTDLVMKSFTTSFTRLVA